MALQHSTLSKVLEILNDGALHAGSDIAQSLTISRAAVWKVIQRLKKYDVDIKSQHQGYQLCSPLIPFDKAKIERLLEPAKIILEIFETIPSTSEYLQNKASSKNITFCLAEYQSKGKGRLGRTWASPFGRNIYCSFRYVFNKDISEMAGLSLVVGILTVQALESINPTLNLLLKWPNDIYVNNQKMGGILIEIMAEANGNCTAIISMGLNINMKDCDLKNIGQPWTSLEHVLDENFDRNVVIARIIQSLLAGIAVFHEKGIEPFLLKWKQYDLLDNQKISINIGKEIRSGIARGINDHGYLLLENAAGTMEPFSYGDATLLKN
ncbi:MAG: biotin--[acetyl-CoA-carboxylase] ligase [Candidatus Paracaedibacter sp.]